jgi:hypothetical protein
VEQQHQDSFGCARTSSALLWLCLQTMDAMQSLSFAEGASGSLSPAAGILKSTEPVRFGFENRSVSNKNQN